RTPSATLFPYTTLFRSGGSHDRLAHLVGAAHRALQQPARLLVVIVRGGAEPALEAVVLLTGQGVFDHASDMGSAERARILQRRRSEEHTSELQSRENLV